MGTGTGSIDLSTLNNLHDNLTQHFWFNSDAGATYGTGVHITLSSQAEFMANPTGQNILMNTDGISIRNGTIPLMVLDNDSLDFNVIDDLTQGTYNNVATFGATGFRMGVIKDGETRLVANGSGIDLIRRVDDDNQNLDVTLAHFGYGYGNSEPDESGQVTLIENPYYTLGYRSPYYDVGNWSVAEGDWTVASGFASHAEGSETSATGAASHAEGNNTVASGSASHAGGGGSIASGSTSFAHGWLTHAEFDSEFVVGRLNSISLQPYIQIIYTCTEDDYDKATLTFPNTYGVYGENGDFLVTYNGDFPASEQAISWSSSTITITAQLLSTDGSTTHFMDGDEIGILLTEKLPLFLVGNGKGGSPTGHSSNGFWASRDGDVHVQGNVYAQCGEDSSGTAHIGQVFSWQGNLKSNLTANAGAYVEGNGSITLKGGHTYLVLAYVAMTNSTNGTVDRRAQIFNKTANVGVLTGSKFVASQVWGTVETQIIYQAYQDVTLTVRGSASRTTTTIPTAWIRAVCIA